MLEAAKWIWDWPSQLWVWPSPLEAAPPSLRVIEVRVDSMVDGHFDFSVSSKSKFFSLVHYDRGLIDHSMNALLPRLKEHSNP